MYKTNRSFMWIIFWLFILTAGTPDILDAIIDFLSRIEI